MDLLIAHDAPIAAVTQASSRSILTSTHISDSADICQAVASLLCCKDQHEQLWFICRRIETSYD